MLGTGNFELMLILAYILFDLGKEVAELYFPGDTSRKAFEVILAFPSSN
jgi:hypothetical protein